MKRTWLLLVLGVAGCAATPAPEAPTGAEVPAADAELPPIVRRLEMRRYDALEENKGDGFYLDNLLYRLQGNFRVFPKDGYETLVEVRGEPLPESAVAVMDIGWGSGHGGSLTSIRVTFEGETASMERVEWNGPNLSQQDRLVRSVKRAQVRSVELHEILGMTRVLPMVTVEKRSLGTGGRRRTSILVSDADVFMLVRLLDSSGGTLLEREWAGYLPYKLDVAPLDVVMDEAMKRLGGRELPWETVPPEQWRSSHFTDAFRRNRDLMCREFHWWVMERSLEMLGSFGNGEARETVRFLRENAPKLNDRRIEKLDSLLDPARGLLEGEPKILGKAGGHGM